MAIWTVQDAIAACLSGMTMRELWAQQMTNGMPNVFVDGQHIPGVKRFSAAEPQATINNEPVDARIAPEYFLRSWSEPGDIMLELNNFDMRSRVLLTGQGASAELAADVNVDRTIGDPTAVANAVEDAEWWIVPCTTSGAAAQVDLDRVLESDLPTDGAKGAEYFVNHYNPSSHAVRDVTASPVSGTLSIVDRYKGQFRVTGATLTVSGDVFRYDPTQNYSVLLGGVRRKVHRDPNLEPQEYCCIIGVAYKWGQLPGTGDMSMYTPQSTPRRVVVDTLLCLGDTPEGLLWRRRRYPHCESISTPPESFDAENSRATTLEFHLRMKPNPSLQRKSLYAYDDLIVAE